MPDFFAQNEVPENQHDEGHDKGDGYGLCQRQVLQPQEHRSDARHMQHRTDRRQAHHPARHPQGEPHPPDQGKEEDDLQNHPHRDQLHDTHRLAKKLGQRVGHRRDHAEAKHQENAEYRTI